MGAVKSLLSKVYLTMAGFPLQETDKYALAAAKAKEVIDMNAYGLFTGYDDLRNPDSDNGVEHIFMTQYALGIAETAQDSFPACKKPQHVDVLDTLHACGIIESQ